MLINYTNMLTHLEILSLAPFLVLIFLPYYYIIGFLILLIIVIINSQINIYFFRSIKYIQKTIFFSLYLIINIILIDDYCHNQVNFLTQFIYLPYYLKVNFIRKNVYRIDFHYFIFSIPRYFKKIFLINLIHVTTTNNLFIFTKNEAIIQNILNNTNKKYLLKHYKQKFNLLTISINYQILEKNIHNFQHIYLGIKTKQNISRKHFVIYANNYLCYFLNKFITNKYSIMLTIWNRF
uniref:Uncharacterized protein n=1 Tax=Vertebrata isogona TaxID=2006944 RepID=A0A1Z1MFD6_9FLOR|nr:hypothetical protein [Vertebrata isogona]ARW64535.1 hypothetical protein [Vertebrata isogona]